MNCKIASPVAPNPDPALFGGEWLRLADGKLDPAENMARDEALLKLSRQLGRPVFRTYGWARPAATFGYSQKYSEIATWTDLRPCLRRCTGGGLVPHNGDWTYSLAIPESHPWYEWSAVESYRQMHEWLRRSMAAVGIETRLAPCCDTSGPGQCFVGSEKFDLVHQGRKIAGAAQRRNRLGQLIQGSVQPPPPGLSMERWMTSMETDASEGWGVRWKQFDELSKLEESTATLMTDAYGREEYHRKR